MGEAFLLQKEIEAINPFLFYDTGFENEVITGGWQGEGTSGSLDKLTGSFKVNVVTTSSDGGKYFRAITSNLIDFSFINTLKFDCASTADDGYWFNFRIFDEADTLVANKSIFDPIPRSVVELDVSGATGKYKIVVRINSSTAASGTEFIEAFKVWGE